MSEHGQHIKFYEDALAYEVARLRLMPLESIREFIKQAARTRTAERALNAVKEYAAMFGAAS